METRTRPARPLLRLLEAPAVGAEASGTGATPPAAADRVQRALDLLQRDPAQPWTVASLAKRVGLSRPVLAREFRARTGTSPMRYLTRLRMHEAARILRCEHESLAAVAARVGYRSEFAFNRAFKRFFGRAPGSYRRSAGQTNAPVFRAAA